jgi:cytochrome c oxidase accessory protein FixG
MARHLPIVTMRSSIREDGTRPAVHPADVSGRFTTARHAGFAALIAVYAVVPWLQVGGHPAVLLDVARRRFHLLGAVFNAQDVWLLFFVLSGVGFALIALTTLAGRVWCGWACPQTVYLEGLFRPLQRLLEGPREQRLRREALPWSLDRLARRAALWALYLLLAAALAHVLLGYFTPIRGLGAMIAAGPSAHPEAFAWTTAVTALLFFNFAWFREQTCVALCPYGRLQSVLTDPDSLVVGYDATRGEPRGKASQPGAGDCVDCQRCVVVCPTGIDIRNGLQLDCVGCARCIDACDEVMDKLRRPRGLVRYDSYRGLLHEPRRVLRPRLALYAVLGAMGLAASLVALRRHTLYEANILRLQGLPYVLEGDFVRNAFDIHLVNKHRARVTFALEPDTSRGERFVLPLRAVTLEPLAGRDVPVFASLPVARYRAGATVRIRVVPQGLPRAEARTVEAPFLGPQ